MENQQKNNKDEDVKEQKPSSPNVEVNEGSSSNSNSNINSASRLDVLKDMSPDLVNTRLTGRNILITEEVIQIARHIGLVQHRLL